MNSPRFCLTGACPTKWGIVAVISAYLAEKGCNITDSSQFDATNTGRFFMRVSFASQEGQTLDALEQGFAETARSFGMTADSHDEAERPCQRESS